MTIAIAAFYFLAQLLFSTTALSLNMNNYEPSDFDMRSAVFDSTREHSLLHAAAAGDAATVRRLVADNNLLLSFDTDRNNILHLIAGNINLWEPALFLPLGQHFLWLAQEENRHGQTPLEIARQMRWIGFEEYLQKMQDFYAKQTTERSN